jgi:CMP/dCMP kinase
MSTPRKLVIAIDGPAGSGKSTIAARLAKKLGYVNLESGAMYRALALKALESQMPLDDPAALRALALTSVVQLEPAADGNRVLLDGRDVSHRIREPDITLAASQVSVHPRVRQVLVARQRELGNHGGVVMEGRDIGTAVFPNAEVKIFLDAHPSVRAERRLLQSASQSLEEAQRVQAEIAARDERDRTRMASPLIPAADAVVLDTSHMSIDEVVDAIYAVVREKLQDKQLGKS